MSKEPNKEVLNKWFADRGDATHRLNYDLTENSTVLDVGGYHGDWAANIYNKYKSKVHVFEPVKKFYNQIDKRFEANPKVDVYEFGLSNNDSEVEIFMSNDASSTFRGTDGVMIQMKSLPEFLVAEDIEFVDLVKINIEGGEYDLLDDVIEKGIQDKFGNIQVQFHKFVDGCEPRRAKIREELAKTHRLTYNYEFVWENWELK